MPSAAASAAAPKPPSLEIADIVRAHGEGLRRSRALTPEQSAVLRAIVRCRTAELGGHLHVCLACGHEHPAYNSCRDRHCPKCQALAQAKWIAEREARILPTTHFHVVFTIPSELHGLARFKREEIFDLLFKASARALLDLGKERFTADIGATMVLHTWTRDLRFHPHVHAIVTGGGLSLDATRWVRTKKKDFFMPVKLLGAVFRDRFIDGLRKLRSDGAFADFTGDLDRVLSIIAAKSWVVYAKRPFGEAKHVLRYLGRYTHRVGISNQRLVSMSEDGNVTFKTKDGKTVTLHGEQFLNRFVEHVLPKQYVKIRHVGIMASSNVNKKLARARALLAPHAPVKKTTEVMSWQDALLALAGVDVRTCSQCGGEVTRRPLAPSPRWALLPTDTS